MDVMLAAFCLVNDFPCGATALAPVLGKSPATLSHEVSPNYPTAKFGLADAVTLSRWSNDRRVLNAFACAMDCMVIPLAADVPGVEGIGQRTAQLAREFGELMAEVCSDLADGEVSANDIVRIEREAGELVTALQAMLATVRAMHKPAAAGELSGLRAVGA